MIQSEGIRLGKYLHYKKKYYEVLGLARHSENCEEMVIYRPLYHCEQYGDEQLWVRPRTMFLEKIMLNGELVPRFEWAGEV
jgi:hypothetical protein